MEAALPPVGRQVSEPEIRFNIRGGGGGGGLATISAPEYRTITIGTVHAKNCHTDIL